MSRFVVDASVAVKWFLDEPLRDSALALVDPRFQLCAPDWLWAEVGNVVAKSCAAGRLDASEGRGILAILDSLPIETVASRPLVGQALDLAVELGRALYDCIYLSMAIQRRCAMVTADRKFHDAIKRGALREHIVWVEDAA